MYSRRERFIFQNCFQCFRKHSTDIIVLAIECTPTIMTEKEIIFKTYILKVIKYSKSVVSKLHQIMTFFSDESSTTISSQSKIATKTIGKNSSVNFDKGTLITFNYSSDFFS